MSTIAKNYYYILSHLQRLCTMPVYAVAA